MNKLLLTTFALMCLSPLLNSETIRMKDGTVYKNVEIIETIFDLVRIKYNDRIIPLQSSDIAKIDYSKYDKSIPSETLFEFPKQINSGQTEQRIYKPYKHLLWVSLLSAVIAWDQFSQASDLNDSIESYHRITPDINTDNLEKQKTKKVLMGIAAVIVTAALTIISFDEVEVNGNENKINLSYRF